MLIHCTMDELIAIRDGEGSHGALRHLDDCDACRDELERLHQRIAGLKALPSFSPPRDRWRAVRDGIVAARRKRRREATSWIVLATAASVALGAGLSRIVAATMDRNDGQDQIAVLTQEANELSEALHVLGPETRVLNGRTAATIALLEDRISLLDARLSEGRMVRIPRGEMIVLMRQRNNLLDALLDVHAKKSTYVGF